MKVSSLLILPLLISCASGTNLISTIEKEDAGYDINAYKEAPAGIRIWGGATVEFR